MEPVKEQIAPEIVQAIAAQATGQGLSINEYLRRILGLPKDEAKEMALPEEPPKPRNEAMLAALQKSAERLKDLPVRGSIGATLKIIREGRAGAIYGYDPTDIE